MDPVNHDARVSISAFPRRFSIVRSLSLLILAEDETEQVLKPALKRTTRESQFLLGAGAQPGSSAAYGPSKAAPARRGKQRRVQWDLGDERGAPKQRSRVGRLRAWTVQQLDAFFAPACRAQRYWALLRLAMVTYDLWRIPLYLAVNGNMDPVEVAAEVLFGIDILIGLLCALQADLAGAREAGARTLTLRQPPAKAAEGTIAAAAAARDAAGRAGRRRRAQSSRRSRHFAEATHGYLTRLSPIEGRSLLCDVVAVVSLPVAKAIGTVLTRKARHWVWWAAALLHGVRLPQLTRFFRERELDFHAEMRVSAFFKLIWVLFGSAHVFGCLFYFLSNVQDHSSLPSYRTFSVLYSAHSGTGFNYATQSSAIQYLVAVFKGFSMISAQNYEGVYPETYPELVLSVVAVPMQVYIAAYILGTINNYLVKKDARAEADRRQLSQLEDYCAQRGLPESLRLRLRGYFEFQQRKQREDDVTVQRLLPRGLQTKLARVLFADVIARNPHLFRGCNPQFVGQLLVLLREVHLMPGEVLVKQHETSSELVFCTRGILELLKDPGGLVRLVRAESEAPNCVCEVTFFMGIAQPYTVACAAGGDATCLQVGRVAFEALSASYPEQQDIINQNLLACYGLRKDGSDAGGARLAGGAMGASGDDEDEDFAALKKDLRTALLKRNAETLSAVTYAASEGDVDTVRELLKRGMPIDSGDYDMRTTMHLAAVEGNLKIVECLVQEGADVNVVDRWGQTPMQEAVRNKHEHVVSFLVKNGARLDYPDPAGQLCGAAGQGDVDVLKQLLDNGVAPDLGDYDQRSALHLAASEGNMDVMTMLLARKAEINVRDRWDGTPLEDAIRAGHELIASYIFSRGGRSDAKRGAVWLCEAASDGDLVMVQMLLANGADVQCRDYDGRGPLHRAASAGQVLVVNHLIFRRAPLNAHDRWGHTPFDGALEGRHGECAVLIAAAGGGPGTCAVPAAAGALTAEELPSIAAARRLVRSLQTRVRATPSTAWVPPRYRLEASSNPRFAASCCFIGIDRLPALRRAALNLFDWLDQEFRSDMAAARLATIQGAEHSLSTGQLLASVERILGHHASEQRSSMINPTQSVGDLSTLVQAQGRQMDGSFSGMGGRAAVDAAEGEAALALREAQQAAELEAAKGELMALLRQAKGLEELSAAREKLEALEASYLEAQRITQEEARRLHAEAKGLAARNARAIRRARRRGGQHETGAAYHSALLRLGDSKAPCGRALSDLIDVTRRAKRSGATLEGQAEEVAAHLGMSRDAVVDFMVKEAFPGGIFRLSSLLACGGFMQALEQAVGPAGEMSRRSRMANQLRGVGTSLLGGSSAKSIHSTSAVARRISAAAPPNGEQSLSRGNLGSKVSFSVSFSDPDAPLDGSAAACAARVRLVLEAASGLNGLFQLLRPDERGLLSIASVEAMCASVGDLGRSIQEELFVYIADLEDMGYSAASLAVDRAAFFAQVLGATGIMTDKHLLEGGESSDDDGLDDSVIGEDAAWLALAADVEDDAAALWDRNNTVGPAERRPDSVIANALKARKDGAQTGRELAIVAMGGSSAPASFTQRRAGSERGSRAPTTDENLPWWRAAAEYVREAWGRMRGGRPPQWRADLERECTAEDVDESGHVPTSEAARIVGRILGSATMTTEMMQTLQKEVLRKSSRGRLTHEALAACVESVAAHHPAFDRILQAAALAGAAAAASAAGVEKGMPADASYYVLSPSAPLILIWNQLITLVGVWHFIEVPLRISFRAVDALGMSYLVPNQVVDGLLLLDMAIKCNTAYWDKRSKLIYDLQEVRQNYFGGLARFDAVAAVPLDLLVWATYSRKQAPPWQTMAWLRLPKMIRTYAVFRQARRRLQRQNATGMWGVIVVKLLPLLAGAMHLLACVLWLLGSSESRAWYDSYQGMGNTDTERGIMQKYLLSLYWVSTTISTTDLYGSMVPASLGEVAFVIGMIVANLTIFSFVLGQIAVIVMEQDAELVSVRAKISSVETMIAGRQLPQKLAVEIRQMFQFGIKDRQTEAEDVNNLLPHSLQVEVARFVCRGQLNAVRLFHSCTEGFLDSISVCLHETTFLPEVFIFQVNEVCTELYIVARGEVETTITSEGGGEERVGVKGVGDTVGELEFLFGIRHQTNARTGSAPAAMFLLRKDDYQQLAKLSPNDDEAVAQEALASQGWVGETFSPGGKGTSEAGTSAAGSAISGSRVDRGALDDLRSIAKVVDQARKKKRNERIVEIVSAAARGELEDMKRQLTTSDVSVNEGDYDQRSALHLAASEGHMSCVRWLVKVAEADVSKEDRYGYTALHDAVRHKRDDVVDFLVKEGASMQWDQAPLVMCEAAARNDVSVLRRIVKCGIDPNIGDYDARTPLHLAASNCCMEALDFLLSCPGINASPEDRYRGTPLQDAVRHGHRAAQERLLAAGAALGECDAVRRMCFAAGSGDLETLQTLHRCGADMCSSDSLGRTPLHVAACEGALVVCEWLSGKQFNVNAIDSLGATPLDDAIREGHSVVAALLESRGGLRGRHEGLHAQAGSTEEAATKRRRTALRAKLEDVHAASLEAQLCRELPVSQARLETLADDLRAACARLLVRLRLLATAQVAAEGDEETDGARLAAVAAAAGTGDLGVEMQALAEDAAQKAEALRAQLVGKAMADTRRCAVMRYFTPDLQTAAEAAATQAEALAAGARALVSEGHHHGYIFKVLKRDMIMKKRQHGTALPPPQAPRRARASITTAAATAAMPAWRLTRQSSVIHKPGGTEEDGLYQLLLSPRLSALLAAAHKRRGTDNAAAGDRYAARQASLVETVAQRSKSIAPRPSQVEPTRAQVIAGWVDRGSDTAKLAEQPVPDAAAAPLPPPVALMRFRKAALQAARQAMKDAAARREAEVVAAALATMATAAEAAEPEVVVVSPATPLDQL